jgi:hypothetical protein
VPWNTGKLIGAKPPLRPKHVWSVRTKLVGSIEKFIDVPPPAPDRKRNEATSFVWPGFQAVYGRMWGVSGHEEQTCDGGSDNCIDRADPRIKSGGGD